MVHDWQGYPDGNLVVAPNVIFEFAPSFLRGVGGLVVVVVVVVVNALDKRTRLFPFVLIHQQIHYFYLMVLFLLLMNGHNLSLQKLACSSSSSSGGGSIVWWLGRIGIGGGSNNKDTFDLASQQGPSLINALLWINPYIDNTGRFRFQHVVVVGRHDDLVALGNVPKRHDTTRLDAKRTGSFTFLSSHQWQRQ